MVGSRACLTLQTRPDMTAGMHSGTLISTALCLHSSSKFIAVRSSTLGSKVAPTAAARAS